MINLSIRFSHPDAIAHFVRYARVDNTSSPLYIVVSPNPTVSPANIATNIASGQYLIESTPLYGDGRICNPINTYTPSCDGLLSFSAYLSGNNIIAQYLAPYSAPKVRINVYYPNGGSSTTLVVNNGTDVVIPLPAGVYGDFSITGQSVCDESSQFYSPQSPEVIVSRLSNNTAITNGITGIDITSITGITGFSLSQIVATGNTVSGVHSAFYGGISATFTGTPGAGTSATLSVNGTIIQCQPVPNTAGGTVTFTAASFADTDNIQINFNPTACP